MSLRAALLEALLQSVWQLALIGLLAAAVLAVLRCAAPALRHQAGMVSLLAMLAIPAITLVDALRGGAQPVLNLSLVLVRIPAPLASALQGWMPAMWTAGASAFLLMHLGGLAWLRRLERSALPLPAPVQAQLDALARTMGIGRRVIGRAASGLAGPFTARLVRPIVWLPAAALAQLPPAQLHALLAHELAHIRRLDWLANGIQCLVEALLFYHPAVWWLSRQVRAERELACDALAVQSGADPIALAQALAQGARAKWAAPALALAAGGGELTRRIAHLLGGAAYRPGWRLPGLLVLLLIASTLIGQAADLPRAAWLAPPPPPLKAPAAPPPPLPPLPPL